MKRNILIGLLVPGLLVAFSTYLEGTVKAQDTTESVVYDDFSDNEQSQIWSVYAEDANTCEVVETNERLELQTIKSVDGAFAGYVANAWYLSADDDFAFRVDFHYELKTLSEGWLEVGLTPNPEDPRTQRVSFGVGCANLFPCYWHEVKNNWSIDSSFVNRFVTEGTLYVSYDADTDTLYFGDTGYGSDDAWMTVADLIGEQWDGGPVYVVIGGSANGLAIDSGEAYLDNVIVDEGAGVESALVDVYSFISATKMNRFYTIDEDERDAMIKEASDEWTYEGIAFGAYSNSAESSSMPVYRFWSNKLASHFYTMVEDEKDYIIKNYPNVWTYEGVAFFAYSEKDYPDETSPVYRFWSPSEKTHYFTMDFEERNTLIRDYGDVWTYEGIGWYAKP